MAYFFYNTDARSLKVPPKPRYPRLIEKNIAVVGGDRAKFGEQLGGLNPGDVLLMYENLVGVVALGNVLETWDGAEYADPVYYEPEEMGGLEGGEVEYRIRVNWLVDLSARPWTLAEIREVFGSDYTPRGTIRRIKLHEDTVRSMVEAEVLNRLKELNTAFEIEPPGRRESKSFRIVRDTATALRVKQIHDFTCQVCGTIIEDKNNGTRYAEAHHIQPLGGGHEGLDVQGNLICVCPNCHVQLDYGMISLDVQLLRQVPGHEIDQRFVDYHNQRVFMP